MPRLPPLSLLLPLNQGRAVTSVRFAGAGVLVPQHSLLAGSVTAAALFEWQGVLAIGSGSAVSKQGEERLFGSPSDFRTSPTNLFRLSFSMGLLRVLQPGNRGLNRLASQRLSPQPQIVFSNPSCSICPVVSNDHVGCMTLVIGISAR